MMRTVPVRAAVLVLVAPLLALVSTTVTAPPAHAIQCTTHYSTDYRYVEEKIPLRENPKWRVMHELYYNHCKDGTERWADPLSVKIGCRRVANASGTGVRDVEFNTRYWDVDHHEINPGVWKLECNSSSWTTKLIAFPSPSRFHRCAGGGPKWDASVKFDLSLSGDLHTRLAGAFWGYIGPVAVDC